MTLQLTISKISLYQDKMTKEEYEKLLQPKIRR